MAKRRRRSIGSMDRISRLPDDIIHLILSNLKFKYILRTGAVSRRFRYLPKSSPVIDMSEWWHEFDCEGSSWCECVPRVDFDTVLDNVLLKRRTTIKKCDLEIIENFYSTRMITRWISALKRRRVQELKLFFGHSINTEDDADNDYLERAIAAKPFIPSCLFQSETLTTLELMCQSGTCRSLRLRGSISLPKLKTLVITRFKFTNMNLTSQFFLNCPVLEEIDFKDCIFENMDAGQIFQSISSTVRVLKLHDSIFE
ncbi:hypothetical protein MKW92_024516, partial [Papaver armeniacum]